MFGHVYTHSYFLVKDSRPQGYVLCPSKLKRSHIYSHMMLCDVNPSRDGLVSAGRAVGTGRLHKLHFPSFKGDNPNKL